MNSVANAVLFASSQTVTKSPVHCLSKHIRFAAFFDPRLSAKKTVRSKRRVAQPRTTKVQEQHAQQLRLAKANTRKISGRDSL